GAGGGVCGSRTGAQPLGDGLKTAAASTRSPWLMFLRAGAIPQAGWIEVAERFIKKTDMLKGAACAAVFRPPAPSDYLRPSLAEIARLLRAALGGCPKAEQGLPIARRVHDSMGGHSADADAEAALLRRLGRRRLVILPVTVSATG